MPANLASGGLRDRTLTLFAVGGSGNLSVLPLLHLCALGLGPRRLKLVLIDPDQSNSSVSRARALMDLYMKTREQMRAGGSPEGYFRTELIDGLGGQVVWSPIENDDHLPNASFESRVDESLMNGADTKPIGYLFNLLYARQLQEMDLSLGFRGVPSIGTVFMNRMRDQPFFQQILTEGQSAADSVYFSIGSTFGGTGAAALPVIGRLLVNGVKRPETGVDLSGVPRLRVGAALLLPYFTLPTPSSTPAPGGGVRPEAALFAQNAAAALPTYTNDQAGYSSYYVLGDNAPRLQEANEVGGEAQKNRSHYVELFAALAALDFAERGGETPGRQGPVFRVASVSDNNLNWADLPIDDASRRRLIGGIVSVHTFLSVFRPANRAASETTGLLKGATWLELLGVTGQQLRLQGQALDTLAQFFKLTWQWFEDMRASSPALELIRAGAPESSRVEAVVAGEKWSAAHQTTSTGGFEVFREWNRSAAKRRNQGVGAFLEVMREGSEAFAGDEFVSTIQEREA